MEKNSMRNCTEFEWVVQIIAYTNQKTKKARMSIENKQKVCLISSKQKLNKKERKKITFNSNF